MKLFSKETKLINKFTNTHFTKKGQVLRGLILASLLVIFMVFVKYYGDVDKTQMVSTEGRTFEKGVVTKVSSENELSEDSRTGQQNLEIKMTTGELKGQIVKGTSTNSYLYGAECEVGMKVIVIVSSANGKSLVSVYSENREFPIYVFIAVFVLLICIIGGKNGVKSVIGLAFTLFCIIYLYMPMIYRGVSPFLSAVVIAVITTIATMHLIGGFTKKTLSAITGTIMGVLVAGVAAYLFGKASNIDGYNVSNIETLIYVGQNTKINIGGLLYSGILVASLGAVMDVAMSISSTLNELMEKNKSLSVMELFKSGMNVGKDMMGTMSNTLILAFVGGSLSTLVVNYAYNLPYRQLINGYNIGVEIMQGVSGSLGVILTVPFVSAIGAALMGIRVVKTSKKEK